LGEFALVIFELSFARDLIDPTIGQILIVTVVITMIMTPFILKNLSSIVNIINNTKDRNKEIGEIQKEELENHIVIIGFGRLGKIIAKHIKDNDEKFIAIESDIKTVIASQKQGLPVIFGNASKKEILKSVNISAASSIIIAVGDSEKLVHICEVVKDMAQDKKTIVKVDRYEEKENLQRLDLSHIIVETEKTAAAMFEEAMTVKLEKSED